MIKTLIPFNKPRRTAAALLTCGILLGSCAPSLFEAPVELPPFSEALVQCTRWMDGSFMQQAETRNAGSPRMQMNQARIWSDKTDGIWMYSELLVRNGSTDRALHQLIYRIQDDPSGGIVIDPYTLPGDSTRFIGAWRAPELFDRVDAFTLDPQAGCAMRLRRTAGGGFNGGTLGEDCRTSRGGATRMNERLAIGSLEIRYGIEGFDANGRTVFGSPEPIVFLRRNATEDPRTIKPGTDQPTDLKMYNMESPTE